MDAEEKRLSRFGSKIVCSQSFAGGLKTAAAWNYCVATYTYLQLELQIIIEK
jgi:hypothetical protein